jgi:SOS-response transcriptional repressor LexA
MGINGKKIRLAAIFEPGKPVQPVWFELNRRKHTLQKPSYSWQDRIKGDSMINACICKRDLVLVRPQPSADNQDIVVAMVEGDATVKRFFRENRAIHHQPENPDMTAIIIPDGPNDVTIIGKVVGVYRDLG